MVVWGLAACANSAKSESKADSLKQELDTSLGKIKDSVKAKGERTLEAVKEKLRSVKVKMDPASDTAR